MNKKATILNLMYGSILGGSLMLILVFGPHVAAAENEQGLNETDVTRVLDKGKGAIPCEAGNIEWDGNNLFMTTTGNGNCMVQISTDKVENFRVTARVGASGGTNYSVGIFCGILNGAEAAPGSIFFIKMNTVGIMTHEVFQVQEGNAVFGQEGNKTNSVLSSPVGGSTGGMDLLEMTKVYKQHSFFVNGNKVADWADTASRNSKVWLTVGSIGSGSKGVFQDFRVYKLEESDEKDIPPKEKPISPPKKKEEPLDDVEIPDDLGEL